MTNYKKPRENHASIAGALRQIARDNDIKVHYVHGAFYHDLFLIKLGELSDDWVIKGGANLAHTVPDSRYTTDIDTFNANIDLGIHNSAELLVDTMNGQVIGFYRFEVCLKQISGSIFDGEHNSESLKVKVFNERKVVYEFSIDISTNTKKLPSDRLKRRWVSRRDGLNIPSIPNEYVMLSYPKESQLADKIYALYKTHGEARRVSTRYRDLYDIGIIAINKLPRLEPVVGSSFYQGESLLSETYLRRALTTEANIRGGYLPEEMHFPDDGWAERYRVASRNFGRKDLSDPDYAMLKAKQFFDPILGDDEDQGRFWCPESMSWEDAKITENNKEESMDAGNMHELYI